MANKPPADRTRSTPTVQMDTSSDTEISEFLSKVAAMPSSAEPGTRGRLIFALDATMSRQPTWDRACHLQSEMFEEAGRVGGLDIKLVYFRGFGECRSSKWFSSTGDLARVMATIDCRGGRTQIGKVLTCGINEAGKGKVHALVYVGDCMEEHIDDLCHRAGELGLLGVPVFAFQEGRDPDAERAFREIARLTNGAFCRFDSGSARELGDLLKAVAAFASGGKKALTALEKSGGKGARLLLEQLK
ncbi:hypothetical protein GCM10011316_33330 [Roseibium aquae]|uniref:VWA domain-containing protein n=1 Tax=Roseibium aquae TaxID=1323746 RepID=A0A916TMN4_9HYPH|nr:VWA domain-containing protein [Roseibium aquae]GGB58592.1 hypothetical protein GCM10011316_33330 [Roseibium aquae]